MRMKKMGRRATWLTVSCLAAVTMAVPAAAAFFISAEEGVNRFSVGVNASRIEEEFGSYEAFEKGKSYGKEVAVRNEGSVSCYVRVFAEIEDPDAASVLSVDFNETQWTDRQEDGFYYYRELLRPGEKTAPLFTELRAGADIERFRMIVMSETVQADGEEDPITAFDPVGQGGEHE